MISVISAVCGNDLSQACQIYFYLIHWVAKLLKNRGIWMCLKLAFLFGHMFHCNRMLEELADYFVLEMSQTSLTNDASCPG